jgi:hypothetical protein
MNKRAVDGVLKDWGERLFYSRVRGKKGKNVLGGRKAGPPAASTSSQAAGPATRERLVRTLNKAPEVMVKITGGGKNMQQIETHMRYISREGTVEIEDENGDRHYGIDEVLEVREGWEKGKIGIRPDGVTRMADGKERKEAFNIMLSMPPGTDRQSVTEAARAFAREQFGNHQYVFAAHHDEAHPHVHLAVKAVGHDGVRLRPRKGDLQHWREQFAEKLREQGIAANATARRTRGVVRKTEKQAVRHINEEHEAGDRDSRAWTTQRQIDDAAQEVATGQKRPNPAEANIEANRKTTLQALGAIARALASGDKDDKQLALKTMQPTTATRHNVLVERLRTDKAHGLEPDRDREQEPGPLGAADRGKGQ